MPLSAGNVDEAGAVARDQQARSVQPAREREQSALGNRLRSPRDALPAFEEIADERVRLQLLQQVVDGQLDVSVVEAHDHPDA